MSIDIIQHLLITIVIGLMCLGINATTWKNMIFCKYANDIQNSITIFCLRFCESELDAKKMSFRICKPLFRCIICMSSIWSIIFWIFTGFEFNVILMMLTVCGFSVVLRSIGEGVIQPYNREDYGI